MTRRKTNEHPEDIKAEVRKTGISLSELARRNGLCVWTVVHAVRRPQPSGNRAIAKHLGRHVHEIWPEWFDEQGNRVTNTQKDSATRQSMPSQKGKAA